MKAKIATAHVKDTLAKKLRNTLKCTDVPNMKTSLKMKSGVERKHFYSLKLTKEVSGYFLHLIFSFQPRRIVIRRSDWKRTPKIARERREGNGSWGSIATRMNQRRRRARRRTRTARRTRTDMDKIVSIVKGSSPRR